jgi:hypothetical protein
MNSRPPTWLYLTAILGVSAIGVGGIVVLEWLRPDVDRGVILQIVGFLTPTVAAMLALIRAELNGRGIEQVKQQAAVAADAASVAAERAVATESKVRDTAAAVKKLAGEKP